MIEQVLDRALHAHKLGAMIVLAAALMVSLAAEASAQEVVPEPPQEVTTESVNEQIKEIQASARTEEQKATLLAIYQQTLGKLKEIEDSAKAGAQFDADGRKAPDEVKRLQAELALPPEEVKETFAPDTELAVLETRLAEIGVDLRTARQNLADREVTEPARRKQRRAEIPDERVAIQKVLDELRPQIDAAAPAGELAEVTLARRTLMGVQKRALEAKLDLLTRENSSYEARAGLLDLRRQDEQRKVNRLEKLQEIWQREVNWRREKLAADEAEKARKAEQDKMHPVLKELARKNIELADERAKGMDGSSPARLRGDAEARLAILRANLEKIRKAYQLAFSRGTEIQHLEGTARAMLRERSELPDLRTLKLEQRRSSPQMLRFQRRELELEDEIAALAQTDLRVTELMSRILPPLSPPKMEESATQARELYGKRLELLSQLKSDYSSLLDTLGDLSSNRRELIAVSEEFSNFISERLVWIRSDPPLEVADIKRATEALSAFADLRMWRALIKSLSVEVLAHPLRAGLWGLLLLAFYLIRVPLYRRIRDLHERASNWRTDSIALTFEALGILAVIAAGPALVLYVVSWNVAAVPGLSEFADMVSVGLARTATVFLGLEFLRLLIRPRGLCEVHFRWPATSLNLLYRHIRWLIPVAIPPIFLFSAMQHQGMDLRSMTLARVTLAFIMMLVSFFLAFILRPKGAIATDFWGRAQESWAYKIRHLWYALCVLAPLSLSLLAAAGYSYTARELLDGLWNSAMLVGVLVLFRAITLRWLILARRKLALEQARKRQEAAESAMSDTKSGSATKEIHMVIDGGVSLATIDQQTRTLIRTAVAVGLFLGLWVTWIDLMPALRYFDQIKLWQIEVPISESQKSSAIAMPFKAPPIGTPAEAPVNPESSTQTVWITLSNVMASILISLATILAARDIPGLLEITLLQKLKMSQGARFAALTLGRYLLIMIGAVLAFNKLGLSWASLGWLIAALSVGIGFGLQEIVANFISGIIILFERPIRVGDIVSIGDVHGQVARIQIRATTILSWDRKEQLIPNKEFITGRLTNWTLTDSTIRLVIPVGVAYDSDLQVAQQSLLRVAREHPSVLVDPAPTALLRSFNPSSILFELRVFLPAPDLIPITRHQLHEAITIEFKQQGIVIAFPQTDIHIKGVEGEAGALLMPSTRETGDVMR